jgi:hypothetical protein
MRKLCCALLVLVPAILVTAAGATGPSWPINTEVEFPATVGPEGGRAKVVVTVDADATDIRLEVYGDDAMRVDPDNKLVVQLNALHPGQSFSFEVGFHPGPGRSYLAVASHARFAKVAGGAVHEYPFGSESAAQQLEHRKCVMQDAEGTWVRVMGCEEEAPLPTSPAGHAEAATPAPAPAAVPPGEPSVPVTLDVARLRQAPPLGGRARLEGYVVDAYRCPPCPPGAQCKPCVMTSAIFVAEQPEHAPFSWADPPADVVAIAAEDPLSFARGVRFRFEVLVPRDRRAEQVDATLVRSQSAAEPIWPAAPQSAPGPEPSGS